MKRLLFVRKGQAAWRLVLSVLLACGLAASMGAADIGGRYEALSHQTMCTCGCAQILGECNHVGCPNSSDMLKTLHTNLAGGMSDHAILVAFEQEYGPESLASPMLTRFNQAAWIVPPAVLILGMLGALLLLRRWREHGAAANRAAEPHRPLTDQQIAALDRVRRETGEQP